MKQPGRKLLSQLDFDAASAGSTVAQLEVHSTGKRPTREAITSALSKSIQGRFTLSLKVVAGDDVYFTQVAPASALSKIEEMCFSYKPKPDPAGKDRIYAAVDWEDLKIFLLSKRQRAP